jgi:murein DD-endopeptidase MepM/ murein hydrolase activator NlpD
MHKGVDFSASTGTPILAAGSGVVEEIGRKSTYGNYVRIRHTAEYSTAYAHASRFAKLRKGDTVKQGEVIAYVGSTGRATGPHLHYEVLVNNQQVDPLRIKMSPGIKLEGTEWGRFAQIKQKLNAMLANLPSQGEIALRDNSSLSQLN